MIKQVELIFDSYLSQLFGEKPEILRFLRQHERKSVVILRVCQQISLAESSNIAKRFDAARHSYLVGECVKMFANAALTKAQQDQLSMLERSRLITEANRLESIKAEFEADQKEFDSKKLVSRPGQVAR